MQMSPLLQIRKNRGKVSSIFELKIELKINQAILKTNVTLTGSNSANEYDLDTGVIYGRYAHVPSPKLQRQTKGADRTAEQLQDHC